MELPELYLALGRPDPRTLVFGDTKGGHLRRQNWRQRVWTPALAAAGEPCFRPYDLRHTCATLLIYEGRPVTEVAAHMGHADPGFTARVYGHVFGDAAKRRECADRASDSSSASAHAHGRSVIGNTYLERGEPVRILIKWGVVADRATS